ncbi:SEC-C motif-containing protein [Microbacterium hydrothermale]|uniref:YchJ family protein n=1 Tax=Microbacterium hydrothermale TaxID=857427 RepID=UPI002226D195|nr:YchJ family metal-binding protein [Microbacterium hydrothermale]MCW2164249.1 SEC-C motif-containing protein [Microbacterium hydrothermale]
MSFGSASSRPSVSRPSAHAPCPCGGGVFGACCAPILDGAPAPSAERLMRSRYTAFAVGDEAHLVRSWHPRTRPEHLDLDDGTVWTGLDIEEAVEDGDAAVVAFRARWRQAGRDGELVERSRFARRGGRWVYVDGDVT